MDAYDKAVKHVQDYPEELTHRGNMAALQFWAAPDGLGFRCTFLGVKTDEGYSVDKWKSMIEREKSVACINTSEREQTRPEVNEWQEKGEI
jgi:hypothetical protein